MYKPQYGYQHKQDRIEAMRNFRDGQRCWRCGKPMFRYQKLHLDHVTPVALGGTGGVTRLTHGSCNDSAGAKLGNRLRKSRGVRRPPRRRLPKW